MNMNPSAEDIRTLLKNDIFLPVCRSKSTKCQDQRKPDFIQPDEPKRVTRGNSD